MKIIYSRKKTISKVNVEERVCIYGDFSSKDSISLLTGVRTALEPRGMEHDSRLESSDIKADKRTVSSWPICTIGVTSPHEMLMDMGKTADITMVDDQVNLPGDQ